jgi:hypothetical protein
MHKIKTQNHKLCLNHIVDLCNPNPCRNAGVCTKSVEDKVSNYYCVCTGGFYGTYCEIGKYCLVVTHV